MAEERQAATINFEKQFHKDALDIDKSSIQSLHLTIRFVMLLVVGLALAIVLIGMRIIEQGYSAEGFAMIVGAACAVIIAYLKSFSRSSRDSEATSQND